MLALASLTLIGGALADVYGKARMLALGCILFGLASAACALAPSPALLIAARVVQGAAAAIVTSASLALIGAPIRAQSGTGRSAYGRRGRL
jgi:MFS family permease|nr:MFS transporter [Mesorhizobium camelthorni]